MTPTKTPFAGLERLAPGDPLSSDGYAFQYVNPAILDRLGQLGAVLHKHDAHAAMTDPATAAVINVLATGGTIPSGTPIFVAYTLTDSQGGETLPLIADALTTSDGYTAPGAVTAAPSYSAGSMLAGDFMYALTITDGVGGETELGDPLTVTVDPGHTNAEVILSGFTALTNASSGSSTSAGWRLWRSIDGGSSWDLMSTGAYSTDGFTDNGSSAGDCSVSPPFSGTTIGTGILTVEIPSDGQPDDATFFSIYADTTGQFLVPCLLGTYPVSDFNTTKTYTSLTALLGAPPSKSQCYPGAGLINPDTDIVNWYWKSPVDTASDLPFTGNNDGDVRVTKDTGALWRWDATDVVWVQWNPTGGILVSTTYAGSWTLIKANAGTVLEFLSSTAVTLTIPTNATVDLPVGCVIEVFQYGAGQVTVAGATGVALRSYSSLVKTAGQYATISLRQRDIDEWVLSGNLG